MQVVLDNLTKKFPSRKKDKTIVTAVSHFTFTVPDGELISLLGPSGCGKSTTLNLISGLETATEGRILFGDRDVTALPPEERGIGLVFQNYALYPHMTVEENIVFPLTNLKGSARPSKEKMHEMAVRTARTVQLEGLLERKPKELSGGQQQRVAIARALIKMPKVLLLDEPLSNLDARLRLQTREEIRRIQKETGITTIFVTHDQDEAMSISDRIVVMKAGVVQQIGKPQQVYDDPDNLFVAQFLGTPPINVFRGRIFSGMLMLGDEAVLDVPGAEDREVYAAIRPEGFVLDPEGRMSCSLDRFEVMGRDTSVVSAHPAMTGVNIRSIVPAESVSENWRDKVRFTLKPNKVLLFDAKTEERIRV